MPFAEQQIWDNSLSEDKKQTMALSKGKHPVRTTARTKWRFQSVMYTQKNYNRLDRFRLIAALLVIAIHTSPLASLNSEADFFLTRVTARISVPFFLMVTGFFLPIGKQTLKKVLKKLCLLYGGAILLYLPLGIYAGHYQVLLFTDALRMLFFDGTFYHLWYFPAAILGILIVSLLRRFVKTDQALAVAALLYLIGLAGDSYYGLTKALPFLNSIYEGMFHVFSYTRNGIFMAPVFLLMGVRIRETENTTKRHFTTDQPILLSAGLILSFLCMTAEAFVLRHFALQRHDSMYLFLPIVMCFLFRLLLETDRRNASELPLPADAPGISARSLRTITTLIYILHPAMIVVVRAAAKLLRLTAALVDNSLLHFFAVSCISVLAAVLAVFLTRRLSLNPKTSLQKRFFKMARGQSGKDLTTEKNGLPDTEPPKTSRAWIELDLSALRQNVRILQDCVPKDCKLMPAVKADAYGHGAFPIARELNRIGIEDLCVACAAEGVGLRNAGITGNILILGYTAPEDFELLFRYRLTQTVLDFSYAEKLQAYGLPLSVHIAVDTGMHRLGIRCEDIALIRRVCHMKNLSVDGIFTHLSACDSPADECRRFTSDQIQAFHQVIDTLKNEGISCRGIHMLSSYGIFHYPEEAADYVRPGIALYGLLSTAEDTAAIRDRYPLQPVLSLHARISSVRSLCAGEAAGYGLAFTTDHDMKLAVLSIGYADGLPRALSCGRGAALIGGVRVPIIGRICMDQTLVDVSGVPDVKQGDTATLIGISGAEEITACEIAATCRTITNELLSRLGKRLTVTVRP